MSSKVLYLLTSALVSLLAAAPVATANIGPTTTTYGSVSPSPGAKTIPYFRDSFSFGGVNYPYTMVGTNPRTSTTTTTVPSVIVPLRFVFADGSVSDPGTSVSNTLASPIFQNVPFTSGTTQYGDAIRRAMFWKHVGGTDYHELLGQPVVLPTQTLNVPKNQGFYLPAGAPLGSTGFHTAAPTGLVFTSWFTGAAPTNGGAFGQLLSRLKLDPASLPIVLSRNVIIGNPRTETGLQGFHYAGASAHGNGNQQVQTAIWADYSDPYALAELPDLFQNIEILSHEVSEWLHDPFVNDTVPAWQSPLPFASPYGCNPFLETGDPVNGLGFQQNGYQLQDEAFLSWFAHQVPSIGVNGQYTYLGTFTEPSPLC